MFCEKCGAQNADNAVSCSSCGAPFVHQQPAPQQPTYQQPMYQQPMYQAQPTSVPGKGLGIASMVIGIVSLVLFCTGWFAIICAIVGCTLGGVGLYKAKQVGAKNGMAVAGLVCSIVALAILVMLIAAGAAAIAEIEDALGM